MFVQAINDKIKSGNELESEKNDNAIKLKEMDHKMGKFQRDTRDAAHKVNIILQSY